MTPVAVAGAVGLWLWLGWLLPLAGLASPSVQAEVSRLDGHAIETTADGAGYRITDVAGEGAPRVGVIERRGARLWLIEADGAATRLSGPLAVPRIAGPGYKVWILGDVEVNYDVRVRRLGILAPPS
jgi:hypothetical protein